ncbi:MULTISPECIES: hypothetical protein [unclassified Streptomyces]|uniref:hypothetical protein n=1 Tax=unclassified Streptomyces TaxID=2593676 RepID=UPI0004C3D831
MGQAEDGTPYRWGQVYAALVAMKGLAEHGRIAPVTEREVTKAAGKPLGTFEALLPDVGEQILAARQRGGAVADAAAAAFADIGRRIPPGRMSWAGLAPRLTPEFRQGYEERIAAYREAWEDIVD